MRTPALFLAIPLSIGLAGCADDGAATRDAGAASGGGSGSGSASHASAEPGTQAGTGDVPEGVAHQHATMEAEIAAEGGETRSGDWRIAYIVEPAEPWFEVTGGRQRFRAPARAETHHIEILPFEASTGRLVPEVPIRVEVVDQAGKVVDAKALRPYYAEFFHYANNFEVPRAGDYTLRATIEPPTFRRHGEMSEGPALARGATVTFNGVRLEK